MRPLGLGYQSAASHRLDKVSSPLTEVTLHIDALLLRLCAAPDVESMEIAGASATLVTACAAQLANQRGENLMCRNLNPIK